MIVHFNIKCKTVNLLDDNIREHRDDLGFGTDFSDTRPKAQFVKWKTDKLGFIKMKNFCSTKGTVKRIKRQATDWKKILILAKDTSDKGLLSKVYTLKLLSIKLNQ